MNSLELDNLTSKALKVLEERNSAFRILYDTVLAVETAEEEEIYKIISDNLRKITKSSFVLFSIFDKEKQLTYIPPNKNANQHKPNDGSCNMKC